MVLPVRKQVLDRDDQGRIADELRLAVDHLHEFVEGLHAVLGPGFGHILLEPLHRLRLQLRAHQSVHLVDVQAGVPDVELLHLCHVQHRLAIGPGHCQIDRLALLGVEATIASGDGEAGHQPFDVPLERAGQRLVEVVDAEDQLPVRGGEDAEVGQMRIAAQLHRQAGSGRARQVGGHQVGRTAVEGERRDQHSAVTDRDQLWHPTCALLLEEANGVRPVRRRLPFPVHRQGDQFSLRLPPGGPLRHCGVFDLSRLP